MKALPLSALILAAALNLAVANTNTARDTTPAQRAQAAEVNDDFDEWGLLGLLGLAGLLGLRRREYTDKDYVGKTGYDRKPGV